jgi:hypothetical protein
MAVAGRIIFYVPDVNAIYVRAIAQGLYPTAAPRDAEWRERYFHLLDRDGNELSFAKLLENWVQPPRCTSSSSTQTPRPVASRLRFGRDLYCSAVRTSRAPTPGCETYHGRRKRILD